MVLSVCNLIMIFDFGDNMNIDSYMPVKIYSGEKCLLKHGDVLSKFGSRCFIVTGKSSAVNSGALNDAITVFNKNSIEYTVFDEIRENPLTDCCKRAGELAAEFNADFILGIGGGSVLDATKAIAIFAVNPDMSHLDIYSRSVPSQHLPVILVGTTSGTGSEVTGVSVLTNADTHMKKSISGADCYANVSFCDYRYTKSVNTSVRISTALDAFSHAVESFFCVNENNLADLYSVKAMEILADYIIGGRFDKLSDKDYENLYAASLYSGLAINISGTCFPHTVGYFFTENYNIPHGIACALLLPHFILRAKKYCPERVEALLKVLKCDFEDVINSIKSLIDVELKYSLSEAESISERWKNGVKNFDRTPGGFTSSDAYAALKDLIS